MVLPHRDVSSVLLHDGLACRANERRMKSSLVVRLDEIQTALRPFLAGRGFRIRGRGFNRTTGDGLTQVVELQMGRFEPPGHVEAAGLNRISYGKFTLNLGVYIPEAAEASGIVAKGFVRETFCAIRARIGSLAPDRHDVWWNIDDAAAPLVEELQNRLQYHGLPFLETFNSRDSVLQECHATAYEYPVFFPVQRMVCAAILVRFGRPDEARTLFVEHLTATADRPRHAPYVYAFAERLGLSLPDPETSV